MHSTMLSSSTALNLIMTVSIAIMFTAGCERNTETTDAPERVPEHLEEAMQKPWSQLIDDVTMRSTTGNSPSSYFVDENCPLVYDFSMHWPLRPQLGNETVGRFEVRASSTDAHAVTVSNRATGTYPVFQGTHHPGQEWWQDELDEVQARLDGTGFHPQSELPDPWLSPRAPLSVAAFFPALIEEGASRGDWSLRWGPEDADGNTATLSLQTETTAIVSIDDEPVALMEATMLEPTIDPDFFGRYLVSESGRLLAGIWSTSSDTDDPSVAALRLTGACDGAVLPPLSPGDDASAGR